MYLARFSGLGADFVTAALKWPVTTDASLPSAWSKQLLGQTDLDLALRVVVEKGASSALLLLSCDAGSSQALRDRCDNLIRAQAPAGLSVAGVSDEFDRLAGEVPPWQIRVSHDGYQHARHALACDFRLYPMVTRRTNGPQPIYQIHLKAHRPDAEVERRVRKYISWLDIERPFTEPVRSMQRILAQRLLQRGSLACEHLAFEDRDSLDLWLKRVDDDFRETTGRIGFPEPPIEVGDFTDWLTTGRHPARNLASSPSVPIEAANLFGENECAFLLSTKFATGPESDASPHARTTGPDVFISYASGDFASAASACSQLEQNGVVCWIAPRDINRDILPYPEAISRALARARAVVVLVSDTASLSVHIPRELDLALERKLYIVPVRLQDVAPAGQLNYLLRTCQWVNAYNREFRDAIDELLQRLRHVLA